MLFLLYSRNTVCTKASLVQREVAKPEVLPEGLYRKRYRFFSGLPMEMQILFVYNPSVSFADSSLYTREPFSETCHLRARFYYGTKIVTTSLLGCACPKPCICKKVVHRI